MARFQVRRMRSTDILGIELQADLLDDLNTRVLVPLIPLCEVEKHIDRLNPVFDIDGCAYVMMTQHLAAVAVSEIGDVVADLSSKRDAIVAAADFLFQGF
ncbi:CcdB family protein [uncultured Roseibium sp.]|uniref:CcdB family protein n=1 Tax=uncultured Roseibium sp. TaxID=1936171 RepID=UPI0032168DE0